MQPSHALPQRWALGSRISAGSRNLPPAQPEPFACRCCHLVLLVRVSLLVTRLNAEKSVFRRAASFSWLQGLLFWAAKPPCTLFSLRSHILECWHSQVRAREGSADSSCWLWMLGCTNDEFFIPKFGRCSAFHKILWIIRSCLQLSHCIPPPERRYLKALCRWSIKWRCAVKEELVSGVGFSPFDILRNNRSHSLHSSSVLSRCLA